MQDKDSHAKKIYIELSSSINLIEKLVILINNNIKL